MSIHKGHWFCIHCDDVTFITPPKPGHEHKTAKCPACRHTAAQWVDGPGPNPQVTAPKRKASPNFAGAFFRHIRQTLNNPKNPKTV